MQPPPTAPPVHSESVASCELPPPVDTLPLPSIVEAVGVSVAPALAIMLGVLGSAEEPRQEAMHAALSRTPPSGEALAGFDIGPSTQHAHLTELVSWARRRERHRIV